MEPLTAAACCTTIPHSSQKNRTDRSCIPTRISGCACQEAARSVPSIAEPMKRPLKPVSSRALPPVHQSGHHRRLDRRQCPSTPVASLAAILGARRVVVACPGHERNTHCRCTANPADGPPGLFFPRFDLGPFGMSFRKSLLEPEPLLLVTAVDVERGEMPRRHHGGTSHAEYCISQVLYARLSRRQTFCRPGRRVKHAD